MQTEHIKITTRTVRELRCSLATSMTGLLPALILILTIESSFADSASWTGDVDGDWNIGDNWVPNRVPNGPADTATFALENFVTDVFLSENTEVNGIVFNAGRGGLHDHRPIIDAYH